MSDLETARQSAGPAAARRRTIRTIFVKEWREFARDKRLHWLCGFVATLMIGALVFGSLQQRRLDHEQAAAAASDRALWTGQGAKNPHAAAHFGQWAFKPESPLALADPGVAAYVGRAVWLEAHKQNETRFRSARDAGVASRLGGLSLAFVLRVVLPLVAVLLTFSAFSGERESRTLRQLASLGVEPGDLLAGKALAAFGVMAALLLPALVVTAAVALLLSDPDHFTPTGQLARVGALALGYGLYLAGFVLVGLAASALAGSSRTALVALLAFWVANSFLAPRLASDAARALAPLPTAREFHAAIALDRTKTFGHDETHPAFVAFRDEVLKRYGVARIEDLPVNFRGLALRKDDESGYAVYDRRFGELQASVDRQDQMRASLGFLFPSLAIEPFSMSFAGTDGWSQYDFATTAEAHRREIQTMVSDDLIHNGRYGDPSYSAGHDLWERIGAFEYRAPGVSFALAHSWRDLARLAAWFSLAVGFALVATRRMRPL
jgi:ABC-2 type transport system permease protein